ncbi:hypothetical protein JK361_18100 [Streptomyces sp. 5-8]|uniref:Uncharacterized protein n=1 Tax=Streptomyces musisoli TaxID=2802280 RepID=A0ABS1P288_9ACTN|nr:hypothetical protein [Streptomyces musisoli]MBL1106490.1 hypothetical protein [Streptomyces musisoli]
MARTPQPRRIRLAGREAVALTPEEYEQLVAGRRQIGGQSARVRVLAHQAKRTEQLLYELETLIAAQGDVCRDRTHVPSVTCPDTEAARKDADTACLRCAVAALLRRHRDATS